MDNNMNDGPFMQPYRYQQDGNAQMQSGGYTKPQFRNPENTTCGRDEGFAIACLVISIIGFLSGWLIIGFGFDIAAIVFSIICIAGKHGGRGFAIAGLIISVLSVLLSIFIIIFAGFFIGSALHSIPYFGSGYENGSDYNETIPYYIDPDEEPGNNGNF